MSLFATYLKTADKKLYLLTTINAIRFKHWLIVNQKITPYFYMYGVIFFN